MLLHNIKEKCEKLGINIAQLEVKADIRPMSIYRWDTVMPAADKLARVAIVTALCKERGIDDDVARLQDTSVKRIDFTYETLPGKLLRREKDAPRLVIDYETKSGSIKTLCFEPANMENCKAVFRTLQEAINRALARAAYLNGRIECSENIHVRGESFYTDSFESLQYENSDYLLSKHEVLENGLEEERIYKFDFDPIKVELVPEPDNQYDPNAIAVIVDGYKVGYVPKGSTGHVRKILTQYTIEKISAEITGGPYKYLYSEEDDEGNVRYNWDKDTNEYSVVINVKYLKEAKND